MTLNRQHVSLDSWRNDEFIKWKNEVEIINKLKNLFNRKRSNLK